ncbi:MAG: DsbA family protein [Alphaproteobacteria bacterium]|nr:DsbA family protein [Alphaproteobacteria bacterium]
MPRFFSRPAAIFALAASFALAQPGAARAAGDQLTPAQKKQVEDIVREYLRKNPEAVLEAIHALQAREDAAESKKRETALAEQREILERDPASPVGGNPKGDVTLVEFFDYRCGYCKRVHETVQTLLKADGNIRFVYKELPLLGPESAFAARAALAAFKVAPGKYAPLQDKLMMLAPRGVTEESVIAQVRAVGLDEKAVRAAMNDPAIAKALAQVEALAGALGLQGTPSFVVGDIVIPGATDLDTLKKAVAAARAKKKS